MNEDNMVDAMRILIRKFDELKNAIDVGNKEITMWRTKFIDSQPYESPAHKNKRIRNAFLYFDCSEFIRKTPEENLQKCIEFYCEDEKSSLEQMKDIGLVGCIEDSDVTSENHKEFVQEVIDKKYKVRVRVIKAIK